MRLLQMITSGRVRIDEIGRALDEQTFSEQRESLADLDRGAQRLLYEKAAGSDPIGLEHFVPAEHEALRAVHHHGANTLPTPKGARLFQKRFCRSSTTENLFGYNEGVFRRLIGPGYFVAVPTRGRADWEPRGGVVIDYFQVPNDAVPDEWPQVVPNHHGLQRLVYHHTRDYMRRVSTRVSIGAAYKGERPLDHYFVLCRDDG